MKQNKLSSGTVLKLLFILALFLRLLGLININLEGDFAYHWKIAGGIIEGKSFPMVGPGASINKNIFLGPIYYYFLSLPYLLGGGNYKAAIIFFSVLNSLSIYPLFYVLKKKIDEKAAIRIVALYSVSSYLIQVQNFPWNAYELPFFIILSLYFLEKVGEGMVNHLPLLFLSLSFGVQMHATFLFLAPLFLLSIPYKKIRRSILGLSVGVALLLFSPWIFFEMTHGFIQIKESIKVFFSGSQGCLFSDWVRNHGHGERCFHYFRNTLFVFRQISMNIFSTRSLSFVFVSLFISLFVLLKNTGKNMKFFAFWILSVVVQFLFYSGNVYMHFFLILVPLPFVFLVLFLREIERKGKWGKVISTVIYLLLINYNIINYLISLTHLRG